MISRVASRRTVQSSLTAVRFYTEGATGAPRPNPDAFNKREKAQEDLYVREQEKAKLDALRASIQKQREHLAEVEKHLDELEKKQ